MPVTVCDGGEHAGVGGGEGYQSDGDTVCCPGAHLQALHAGSSCSAWRLPQYVQEGESGIGKEDSSGARASWQPEGIGSEDGASLWFSVEDCSRRDVQMGELG